MDIDFVAMAKPNLRILSVGFTIYHGGMYYFSIYIL